MDGIQVRIQISISSYVGLMVKRSYVTSVATA